MMTIESPISKPEMISSGTVNGRKFEIYKLADAPVLLIEFEKRILILSLANVIKQYILNFEEDKNEESN